MVYVFISLFIIKISLGLIGYKIYKIQNQINDLKKDNIDFKIEERTKREIGWDSIWKMVNQNIT
tara:strand:+ start:7121 stop:7312 length:192 start_codon:yes stop_codon:yes gene_type:complete